MPREGHDVVLIMPANGPIISIHVPREGHDAYSSSLSVSGVHISIHVPREGHDMLLCGDMRSRSTISIHVPREGHDSTPRHSTAMTTNFNPRAPRGARLANYQQALCIYELFQSTCPARGTTLFAAHQVCNVGISIHVPREGHDSLYLISSPAASRFQSTCPARGTTSKSA